MAFSQQRQVAQTATRLCLACRHLLHPEFLFLALRFTLTRPSEVGPLMPDQGGQHVVEDAGLLLRVSQRPALGDRVHTPATARGCGGWSHGHDVQRARIRVHPASPTKDRGDR